MSKKLTHKVVMIESDNICDVYFTNSALDALQYAEIEHNTDIHHGICRSYKVVSI